MKNEDEAIGKILTSEKAARLREHIIQQSVIPYVQERFERYPTLQSAMMLVAQYWNDDANDAVHLQLIFSVLEKPDIEAYSRFLDLDQTTTINRRDPDATPRPSIFPGLGNMLTRIITYFRQKPSKTQSDEDALALGHESYSNSHPNLDQSQLSAISAFLNKQKAETE